MHCGFKLRLLQSGSIVVVVGSDFNQTIQKKRVFCRKRIFIYESSSVLIERKELLFRKLA